MIIIDSFGGIAPRTDASKLPGHGASLAMNARLHSGALRGWRKPASLVPAVPVTADTRTIFFDPGCQCWFTWEADVDIVPGPVADPTALRRYYYTGDTAPRKTDSAMAIDGTGTYPQTWLNLGVPAPTAAPTAVNNGGGSGTAEDRAYVVTYVSVFSGIEEESAPSPSVSVPNCLPGDSIVLTWVDVPPTSGYNITKRRVYRSAGAAYLFVKESVIASEPTSTTDTVLNDDLGEAITSTRYYPPPSGLKGLIAMPNGILAGFIGNEVYFSEAYQPHAWPYSDVVAEQIVALVPSAQGCYLLTEGHPYYCTGTTPDGMTLERLNKYAPCMAKRSAVNSGDGVLYASYNGVTYLQGSTVTTFGPGLFTQEEWGALGPENMHGVYYDERYMLWHPIIEVEPLLLDGSWVLDGSETLDGMKGLNASLGNCLVFDTSIPDAPLTKLVDYTLAAHIVRQTGKLYFIQDGEIRQFDGDEYNRHTYEWQSKLFLLPRLQNFSVLQVIADHVGESDSVAAQQAAQELANTNAQLWADGAYNAGWGVCGVNEFCWAGSSMLSGIGNYIWDGQVLVSAPQVDSRTLTVKFYADGILRHSANLTDNRPIRLPSGYKASNVEVALSGNKTVRRVVLGTSMREIRQA